MKAIHTSFHLRRVCRIPFDRATPASPERGAEDVSGPKASAVFANMAALTAIGSTAPTLHTSEWGHKPCTAAGPAAGPRVSADAVA